MKDPDFKIKPWWNSYQNRSDSRVKIIRKLASVINAQCSVIPLPDPNSDMITIEQRMNMHHLLLGTFIADVQGDIVEVGSYEGQSCIQLDEISAHYNYKKATHIYDHFQEKYNSKGGVKQRLLEQYSLAGLKAPTIHEGNIEETLPSQLPDKISFAHIDTGMGQDKLNHKKLLLYILDSIYPKMSKNAVCVLMDYHDKNLQKGAINPNPGVILACNDFFADKPEEMTILNGGYYSHAYFRKQ
jgi:O-methyltransferase